MTLNSTLYSQGIAHFDDRDVVVRLHSEGAYEFHTVQRRLKIFSSVDEPTPLTRLTELKTFDDLLFFETAYSEMESDEARAFWAPLVIPQEASSPLRAFAQRLLATSIKSPSSIG